MSIDLQSFAIGLYLNRTFEVVDPKVNEWKIKFVGWSYVSKQIIGSEVTILNSSQNIFSYRKYRPYVFQRKGEVYLVIAKSLSKGRKVSNGIRTRIEFYEVDNFKFLQWCQKSKCKKQTKTNIKK